MKEIQILKKMNTAFYWSMKIYY